jgi:CheY-like chemotaxis protein
MNDENPPRPSVADTAKEKAGAAGRQYDSAIEEIKENFGMLLELRDRKISELQGKLAKRTAEAVKPRLLVVDDAESTSAIMGWYLDGQAVEVVCVAGSQALERLRSEIFDAIILEASTSVAADVDGMALCRELCGSGQGNTVIVMSSRPGNRIRDSVEKAGAIFLRKPFKREEVVEIVRNIHPRIKK